MAALSEAALKASPELPCQPLRGTAPDSPSQPSDMACPGPTAKSSPDASETASERLSRPSCHARLSADRDFSAAATPQSKSAGTRTGNVLTLVFLHFSLLLFAAHCYRMGAKGLAAAAVVWGLVCCARAAWMRPVTILALLGISVEWFLTCADFLQVRLFLGQPWLRLVLILCGVALVAQAAALLVCKRGRTWFVKQPDTALVQTAAFMLTLALMAPVLLRAPWLLLSERLVPGSGPLQALCAALWAAFVCARLMDRTKAHTTRLVVWRLFSAVFFAQFALAMLGLGLLFMTGSPHLPVPGIVLAGALYRGEPGFMLIFFLVTVLLAGPAWCSHLCYFGSWDAASADHTMRAEDRQYKARYPGRFHPMWWRAGMLVLTCLTALVLRLSGAPLALALSLGLALGLLIVPVALLFSRRYGQPCYCTMICPLGFVACLCAKLSPWRLRTTSACTRCGACIRACRYTAWDRKRLECGRPGPSCVLCRDCLTSCPHKALTITLAGTSLGGRAEQIFVCLTAALHAAFLFLAMV